MPGCFAATLSGEWPTPAGYEDTETLRLLARGRARLHGEGGIFEVKWGKLRLVETVYPWGGSQLAIPFPFRRHKLRLVQPGDVPPMPAAQPAPRPAVAEKGVQLELPWSHHVIPCEDPNHV